LQTLGISTAGLSAFFLPQGQNLNNVTLGQLVGAVPLVQLGGQGGFGGLGGFPFGFGTGVGTVTGTVTGP
jgi:hypothetical protein